MARSANSYDGFSWRSISKKSRQSQVTLLVIYLSVCLAQLLRIQRVLAGHCHIKNTLKKSPVMIFQGYKVSFIFPLLDSTWLVIIILYSH